MIRKPRLPRGQGFSRAEDPPFRRRQKRIYGRNPSLHPIDASGTTLSRLAKVFHTAPLGLCLLDTRLRLLSVNAGFVDLFPHASRQESGRHLGTVSSTLEAATAPLLRRAIDQNLAIINHEVTMPGRHPSDAVRSFSCDAHPVHGENGRVEGVCLGLRDISHHKQIEQSLSIQEKRVATLLDTAIDAIVIIDERGRIELFNRAAETMFGHSAEEIRGRNITVLMPSPFREQHNVFMAARRDRRRIRRPVSLRRDLLGQRSDGTVFPIALAIGKENGQQRYVAIIRDLSQRKALEKQLLSVAEQTQQEIGQILHDDVGQELTGLLLKAETLQEQRQGNPRLIASIMESLERTRDKVRTLSHSLTPLFIEAFGLPEALQTLVDDLNVAGRVQVTLTLPEEPPDYDRQIATQLYHIAQEAVNNALRHGQPDTLTITLTRLSQGLILRVADNGCGISGPPGRGLEVMRYRAGLVEGQISLSARAGGGTELICYIIN